MLIHIIIFQPNREEKSKEKEPEENWKNEEEKGEKRREKEGKPAQ